MDNVDMETIVGKGLRRIAYAILVASHQNIDRVEAITEANAELDIIDEAVLIDFGE